MDLEEAKQENFKNIFEELNNIYSLSQGIFLNFYYRHWQKKFKIQNVTREWEYPWAIINSKIKPGQRVLDAGCGSTPLLPYLFKRGCLCYGIDNRFSNEIYPLSSWNSRKRFLVFLSKIYPLYFLFHPSPMEGINNPARVLGMRINYIKGDLTKQPFSDNSFDRIFCISTLEHLNKEEILSAAREFKRVLKKDGLLIVTVDCLGTGLLWQKFIEFSALTLDGESELEKLPEKKYHHNVVGFVLKK